MPNFKAKTLSLPTLPFKQANICFEYLLSKDDHSLLYTTVEDESFFILIKKNKEGYIIKGDKLTRPIKLALLQAALILLESFSFELSSRAIGLSKTSLKLKNQMIISDIKEIEQKCEAFENIFIEIGFGSGRHLIHLAKNHPNTLILGLEIFTPAIEQVAKLIQNENKTSDLKTKNTRVENVVLSRVDARTLCSIIRPACVDKIFLHFPVPWDKKPHRRIISKDFLQSLERILKKDGIFELRTDSIGYLKYTLDLFLNQKATSLKIEKNKNIAVTSKYEARWKRQEKDIYELSFIKQNSEEKIDENSFEYVFDSFNEDELLKLNLAFKNQSFKQDSFFLHLEQCYVLDKSQVILRLSFGSFYMPYHGYIKLCECSGFLFKEPLKTYQNKMAFKFLKNILKNMVS